MLGSGIYNDFVSSLLNEFCDWIKVPEDEEKPAPSFGIRTDVKEYKDSVKMDLELPGYKKDEISIQLKEGKLIVSAEHKASSTEAADDGKYLCKERHFGKCQRSFMVGKDVNKNEIRANFENGILTLTIPKTNPQADDTVDITIE